MNTYGTGFNISKNATNRTAADHKEGEQLEDRRNVGESSCNFGDGTDVYDGDGDDDDDDDDVVLLLSLCILIFMYFPF